MVAVLMQDRADALDRAVAGRAFGTIGIRVGEQTRFAGFLGGCVGAIEPLHRGNDGWRVFRGVMQFGASDRRIAEQRIG